MNVAYLYFCFAYLSYLYFSFFLFYASYLLCKNMGGWWRWALVSLDGVAPSRVVGVSASVNLRLHHEVLFWHRLTRMVQEKGCEMVVVWYLVCQP